MKALCSVCARLGALVFYLTAALATTCSFDASRLRAPTLLVPDGPVDALAEPDAAEPGAGGALLVDTTAANGGAGSAQGGSPGTGGVGGSSSLATPEPNATDASLATGGANAADGPLGSGGVDALWSTGGAGTGGVSAGTAGVTTTGGVLRTGGVVTTGGIAATGGVTATGGVIRTGGISATGGIAATGGVIRTGGVAATGGAGTGGSGIGGAPKSWVISVDFVGGVPNSDKVTYDAHTVYPMRSNESAGVKPATHWNSAQGNADSLSSLMLADGTLSAAAITWNCPWASGAINATWYNYIPDAPGDVRMMNGDIDPNGTNSPATIGVTGLAASMSSGYDVYVYYYGDIPKADTRTYRYIIGSMTHTVKQTGPNARTFGGYALAPEGGQGNYVVFRNVTGTAFTLTAQPVAGATDGRDRAPVSGIQIVYPSGS